MQIVRHNYEDGYRLVMDNYLTLDVNSEADRQTAYDWLLHWARKEAAEDRTIGRLAVIGRPGDENTYVDLVDKGNRAVARYSQEWHTVIYNLETDTCYRV